MKYGDDYVEIARLEKMEFGILYHQNEQDPVLEMVVIDDERFMVRTLGYARDIQVAYGIMESCIQQGFNEKGLTFAPCPSFHLNPLPELLVI